MLLSAPELELEEDEAKKLARAVSRVSQLYEIPILSEKAQAWIGLGFVAVPIYGPRLSLMAKRFGRKGKPTIIKPPHPINGQPIQPETTMPVDPWGFGDIINAAPAGGVV